MNRPHPDPQPDERDLGGPGWEREHATDYGEYLDALADPDDPMHEAAMNHKVAMEAEGYMVEVVLKDGSTIQMTETALLEWLNKSATKTKEENNG